jgi:hypothetical protein
LGFTGWGLGCVRAWNALRKYQENPAGQLLPALLLCRKPFDDDHGPTSQNVIKGETDDLVVNTPVSVDSYLNDLMGKQTGIDA